MRKQPFEINEADALQLQLRARMCGRALPFRHNRFVVVLTTVKAAARLLRAGKAAALPKNAVRAVPFRKRFVQVFSRVTYRDIPIDK